MGKGVVGLEVGAAVVGASVGDSVGAMVGWKERKQEKVVKIS